MTHATDHLGATQIVGRLFECQHKNINDYLYVLTDLETSITSLPLPFRVVLRILDIFALALKIQREHGLP